MKTKLTILIYGLLLTGTALGQEKAKRASNPKIEKQTVTESEPEIIKSKNNKFSFITGIGASYITDNLYQNPAINATNNNVVIEESQNIKTNLSIGIVYTPKKLIMNKGKENEEIVPYGVSFATFINPIALSKATENQSFFNITDFGIGLGWKFAGNVLIMATVEFLGVRQSREWFIEEFKNNDKQFLVNESPQLSFDITDNNIFETKIATTIGFKVCYTFDIVKNFQNELR